MKKISVFSPHSDAGVGSIIETVCRAESADLVVRLDGKSSSSSFVQFAGHHIRLTQIPVGIVTGASSMIAGGIVNPATLAIEIMKLGEAGINDVKSRLFVDGQTFITTPYHTAIARMEMLSGLPVRDWMGDGLAVQLPRFTALDVLMGGKNLKAKVDEIYEWATTRMEELRIAANAPMDVTAVFNQPVEDVADEISQLPDMVRIISGYDSFLPWCSTVVYDGLRTADEIIGVIPVYLTERVKNRKPSALDEIDGDNDNRKSATETKWCGNVVAAPVLLGGVDTPLLATHLAVTKCDKLRQFSTWKYRRPNNTTKPDVLEISSDKLIGLISENEGLPVKIESHGKTYQHKVLK